jgi:putative flavoprotein involved in K+ transport
MKKDEIIAYLDGFKQAVGAPLREGVAVRRVVPQSGGGFSVSTSEGECSADQVVVAAGSYHTQYLAERIRAFPISSGTNTTIDSCTVD